MGKSCLALAAVSHTRGSMNRKSSPSLFFTNQMVDADLLQAIVHAIPDPVFVHNRQHRRVFANQAFHRFFLPTIDTSPSDPSLSIYPKSTASMIRERDDLLFRTESAATTTEQMVDGQGVYHSLVVSKTVCRDGQGEPVLVGVVRIGGQSCGCTANERQVNRVLETLALGGTREKVLGMILEIAEEQFDGMTASILLADTVAGVLRQPLPSRLPAFFQRAIDGTPIRDQMGSCGTAAFRKQRVIAEDLQTHPYWRRVRELTERAQLRACWSEPIITSNGKLAGTFALYYNQAKSPVREEIQLMETMAHLAAIAIEHHQVQEDKALLRRMLSDTIDSMPSVLIGVDEKGKVTQWNLEAEKQTGVSQQQAVGRSLAAVYPNFSAGILKKIEAAVNSQSMFSNVPNIREQGGGVLHEELTVYPLSGDGSKGAVIRVDDVSERVRMEEAMVQADRMMSIGELAGGIAHDFNNILVGILGNLNLAALYLQEQKKVADLIQKAEDASYRAKELANQLLTFAKGGAPVRRVTTLDSIIPGAAQFMVSGSQVRCSFDFPPESWPVDVDEEQISQVVHHLVLNAKEAMPEGGTIGIHCRNLVREDLDFPPLLDCDRCVAVTVSDQGPGIPESICQQIFTPYFSTKPKGNGLGLAVCYSIINRHGGYITAEKRSERGATLTFFLPASDLPAEAAESVCQLPVVKGEGRILVMDDEPVICTLFSEMLQYLGFEPVTAHDGEEAIRLYAEAHRKAPICLVIMDLTVPSGMGGKEAVKRLHSRYPEAKVIVTSGYSSDPILAGFREYGFCGALAKPFELGELAALLSRVLAE